MSFETRNIYLRKLLSKINKLDKDCYVEDDDEYYEPPLFDPPDFDLEDYSEDEPGIDTEKNFTYLSAEDLTSFGVFFESIPIRDYQGIIPFEPSFFQPAETDFLTKYPINTEHACFLAPWMELHIEDPPIWQNYLQDACEYFNIRTAPPDWKLAKNHCFILHRDPIIRNFESGRVTKDHDPVTGRKYYFII